MNVANRPSLGDDAEAFHATLAFLDEYDGDIDLGVRDDVDSSSSWSPAPTSASEEPSQSEPDSEATQSPDASPMKMTAKKPTAKRRHKSSAEDPRMSAKTAAEGAYPSRTRRAELEYLRGKVGELEERLRVLKQAKRPSDVLAKVMPSDEASPSDPWELAVVQQQAAVPTGGESMWEDVAMRQFEQRQQAEIENQRLRSMLEGQLKLARGLERLLKRTNADLILPTNPIKRPRLSPDGRADAAAFDDLMNVIDDMYLELNSVFADSRFDHEDAPLRDIQVSNDTALGTVVDVFDARNLPFDLRPTSDAVWGYFVNTSVSFAHQQVEITDDVIKKHFEFVVEVQRYQSHFRGRLAGRRYFEEGRIVILWVAMIEPEMPGGASSEGMVVRQKGWTIIKRPNKLPPNCDPDAPVARIQSKHVAIPYVYEDVPDHKRRTGTLTNFVLQSVYSHLQTSRKIIENVLIEGAMKNHCVPEVYALMRIEIGGSSELAGGDHERVIHVLPIQCAKEFSKATMDDDVIHATKAFLDEFDSAPFDEDAERRRHAPRNAGRVAVVQSERSSKSATSKPRAQRTPKSKAAKQSAVKTETVTVGGETVPLAQPKTRKEELEFLRDQVMELEEKLRLLKRGVGGDDPPLTTASASQSNGELVAKPKRIASMWEDLAMRQYQQRQRAEVENLKLKGSLEDQLKVAKSLQRMLKRSKIDALTPQNHAKRTRRLQDKSSTEEAAEFEELSSTVMDMYDRIGDAFADARFATADVDFRDVIVRQDARTGTIIEVLNAKMVPFDVDTTATAMWDYFIHESLDAQGFQVERTVELTNDTVMKSIRVELEVKRYCGRFRGKVVGRRYCEADRVVIVWAVLAEPVEVSDAPMDGIILRQRGWTIVRKPKVSDLDGEQNVAMIQTMHVAIPMLYDDDVPDHKRKLELLTNYVVAILFYQIESTQQVLENLLFERLRNGTATPNHAMLQRCLDR